MKSSDSVFNKMSDKQWERLHDEHGWAIKPENVKKQAKALKRLTSKQEAEEALRQQTEMFWLLQLQFLSNYPMWVMPIFRGLFHSDSYVKTKFSNKIHKILIQDDLDLSHEQFECLCTHFALQLAGVEE